MCIYIKIHIHVYSFWNKESTSSVASPPPADKVAKTSVRTSTTPAARTSASRPADTNPSASKSPGIAS